MTSTCKPIAGTRTRTAGSVVRTVLFWTHLAAGVMAGAVILVMAVTGVLLTYERQMLEWADSDSRSKPPSPNARPMSLEALTASVAASRNQAPVAYELQSDPQSPVRVTAGPRTLLVDAYSGHVIGEASQGMRKFFRTVTDWHRWLAVEGPGRATGRAITGACNLAFFVLVLSGIYLWIPRNRAQLKAVLFFRPGLAGKARDFNWHNVIGIWSAIPLAVIVAGGVVISYPWATNLLYSMTGSTPPQNSGRPPASSVQQPPTRTLSVAGLDAALELTKTRVPDWQTISVRLPGSERAPFTFSVAKSHRGRPDLRSTITVSRDGARVEEENFSSYNAGRKARSWLRFLHTGEALGVAGQTVAGGVSAGSAVMIWTGIALSWRRYRNWRIRRQRS